jgi:formate dehydrogenase
MPDHGMTPHISGRPTSAQAQYAYGTREVLECYIEERQTRCEYVMLQGGMVAASVAHSYSMSNAPCGSEATTKFENIG